MIYSIFKILYRFCLCRVNIHSLRKNGFSRSLADLDVKAIKGNSDTLFILGSGASINRISDQGWMKIGSEKSVGLNYWPIHDFVPSFLMFELPRGDRARYFFDVFNKKAHIYKNIPLIFKGLYKNRKDFGDIKKVQDFFSEELRENMYLPMEFSIPGRDITELEGVLEYLFHCGFFNSDDRINSLAQYRGTVTCAIIFGIKAGFKNIVLCGVDLNDTCYFYEDSKGYYESLGIIVPPSGQVGDIHKTNIKVSNSIPISDAIIELRKMFVNHFGGELFTCSKNSALFPGLKYYDLDNYGE
jgi:hypothetical protein